MKTNIFYKKFANVPLEKRMSVLSFAHNSPLWGQTLNDVYDEIQEIGDRIRPDIIRQTELLDAVEKFLIKKK